MGLIRAELSMSQPANVIYTHKKFKRTSSQSWKDAPAEPLPCSEAETVQWAAASRGPEAPEDSWSQDRDGAESLLIAASLVEQREAGERLQRLASNAHRVNGTGDPKILLPSNASVRIWSCRYCNFGATCEDELKVHEAVHARLCSNCRAPEMACICEHLDARQCRSTISETSISLVPNPSYSKLKIDKHNLPADLSVTSSISSNNNIYPNDENYIRNHYSLIKAPEGAYSKSIYKPKFRASYSLDESTTGGTTLTGATVNDDVFDVPEAKYNVHLDNHLLSTLGDLKGTGTVPRQAGSQFPLKGDEPGTALRLGSIVGSALFKGIKSPSPDLGEHIDKLIDQNKLIMDSDNPLRNRKYRRQTSIGSSSSENENSCGSRSRRSSANDPSKCKTATSTVPNRVKVPAVADIQACQTSVSVPVESHSSVSFKRSLSVISSAAGPSLSSIKSSCAAAPTTHIPTYQATPANLRRFVSVDNKSPAMNSAELLIPGASCDRGIYLQQMPPNPDPDVHKLLLRRGNMPFLPDTSVIPVTNPSMMVMVCPNCSTSFRTRESLEVHLERHCSGKTENLSTFKNVAAAVDNSAGGAHLVQRTGAGHETAHEQQKRLIIRDFSPMHMRSSSVENEPRLKNHREESSQSRGSSLGADVRLNTEHMKQPFQSMPQYSRQQSVDVPQPPTKKQKISSEPQPGDFSITSVHPVLVRNGVVLQRARVSVKEVEENNLPKKLQLCGGEVKICDGSKYKTMRIDTSECSRSHALGMSSPICEVKTESDEPQIPESHVVTLSTSGLNCGGTMVESRVNYLATSCSLSSPSRSGYSSDSSNEMHRGTKKLLCKDIDLPSISLSNLQQYAPQLTLPNLSIPGVPIPNMSGVLLSKMSTGQPSAMKHLRTSSFSECFKTSSSYGSLLLNSQEKPLTKLPINSPLVSLSKDKIPFVPGIPGPYSQASLNLSTSITSQKPATIVSTIPILASKSEMSNEVKVRPESPKVFTACNTLVTKNTPPTSTKTNFSYATPDVRTSSEVPLQSDKVVPALLDQKDIFIAPRKRPDTLPLKPQQFVNKSTAQLIGSIITSPDTPRPKKSCAQLLLDGSAYTYLRLKVSTKTYYCCIFRPQPMYVPQSPESKISMYSNWQIRKPAEDNPFNLSISESMGLYSSCQCTNPAYSVAKPALSLIYTYSDRKMIDAIKFVQKEKQSLSAVTLAKNLVPSLGENKMRYGESPINSVKLSDSAGDVQISQSVAEETKISSSVSVFSREPSEDSRLSSSSSRIRICDGGFKSTEEYTYVRGRGRGRYVCETCGIRCKKPSMLKKHIRTHTNFRPYPCTLCTSRFKTKGNLTKHLKSKAHFQRCIQLGVPHEPPSSSGDDASTEMDYDDNDEDDDDDDGEEDDDEEDDECDEDMRESRENSSMRDNSRENSYVRESSCDNSYVNESREGSSMRDSRENSYLGESRENSYAREIRENSCIREIRENSCVRESRENSCIRENCENSYIRESRGCVPESRENSCIPEFAFVEENIVLGSGNGFEKNKEDFCFSTGHLLSSAAMSSHEEIKADEEVCIDLRVSKVACRSAGSPASAPDDAPMDLSIKKSSNSTQPGAILPSSLLPHVVSSAKITIASVTSSRPSFLQLVPPKSSTSLVSPLTPIREQPADILSPVTDSSMLLKSIYSTTERASRVSVLSSQAGYPHSIAASQASGVMMKAYLTQRAIQDTFIKRHQYQGQTSYSDASNEPSDIENSTHESKTGLETGSVISAAVNEGASSSPVVNISRSNSSSTVASCTLKPKSYYQGKWQGTTLQASPSISLATSCVSQVLDKPIAGKEASIDEFSPLSVASLVSASTQGCEALIDDATFKGKLRAAFDLVEANDRGVTALEYSFQRFAVSEATGKLPRSPPIVVKSTADASVSLSCAVPKKNHIMAAARMVVTSTSNLTAPEVPTTTADRSPAVPEGSLTPGKKPNYNNRSGEIGLSDHAKPIAAIAPAPLASNLTKPSLVSQDIPSSNSTSKIQIPASSWSNASSVQLGLPTLNDPNDTEKQATNFDAITQPDSSALTQTEEKPETIISNSSSIVAIDASNNSRNASAVAVEPPVITSSPNSEKPWAVTISAPLPPNSRLTRCLTFPESSSPSSVSSSLSVTLSVPSSVAVPVSRSVNSHPSRTTTVTTPLSASSGTLRTVTVAGPSSAMNLTVLNSSNSKTGTSFLSPSGVVPNHANNRSAPEDGRCRCYICHKEFARSSQLALHLNIHYMERRFRCESCAVSFRTSGHLQKHERSASHFNKVNMNLTFGAASTENPRPFKCHDCKIAFRIHGHLAKHLRSKMHILKLECLSKLPFGLYAEMERTGLTLANIDTTDCEHSLLSLQSLAGKLFAKEPEKLLAWRNGTADTEGLGETSRPRTVSGSSVNSDEYLLADDQDEPSPLPDSGDENESTPVTPANSSSGNVSSLQAAVEKTIPDVAIEPQASLSTSPTPSSLSPELPSSSVSHVAVTTSLSPPPGVPSTPSTPKLGGSSSQSPSCA
ncbi:uncharacterized protein LOC108682979 [Hyalella azteca]|uniref:Uncharacterized protein LOC108682979 n=1 Tax=Hyalella azteca TaxID=294128 RepID=A0A8B7PP07_HYAAZ|nr:uncharacterized protein LOC108682979 [Hyalella azteca]